MEQWTKSLREDNNNKFRHRSKNPSFSSSLLDAIYRSIDEGEEELVLYKETMRKKQSSSTTTTATTVTPGRRDTDMEDFTRACLIEKWMEKKVSEKVVVRRRSEQDFTRSHKPNVFHSASSSSDSSSAGGFSSSEAESLYGSQRPKPIRTSLPAERFERVSQPAQKQKQDRGGFNKTKSKAMKLYGDLKKQPISPGGKLANFLNSLFTAGNTKKAKFSTSVNGIEDLRSERKSKSTQTSTCSSASSFSRSCLSKTPSSRGDVKRTVRFYPVSVIVDEENRPCGHKSLHQDHHQHQHQHQQQQKQQQEQQKKNAYAVNEELKARLMEKNRKIEAAAREYLYQQKVKTDFEMRDADQDYEDDEDDDAESYASSDLFELDNFAAIGVERYREELPVYETTHLEKNRAISKSFIL